MTPMQILKNNFLVLRKKLEETLINEYLDNIVVESLSKN